MTGETSAEPEEPPLKTGNPPAGIEARLHHKDFGLVLEAARKNGVFMPLTAAVGQQLNALMAMGWGRDDTSALLRVLENT